MAQFSWMQGYNSHTSGSLEKQAALAVLAVIAQLRATFNSSYWCKAISTETTLITQITKDMQGQYSRIPMPSFTLS
jgi:hypothetical protein